MRQLLERLRWRALRLRAKGLVVLAIPVVSLVMTALLVYLGDVQRAEASAEVRRTRVIEIELQRTLTALVDAETSVRGFLLTGEREWLAPYERTRAQLPGLLADLGALIRDPGVAAALKELESVEALRLESLAEVASDRAVTGLVPTDIGARVRRGKTLMDQARALVASMQARQNELLAQREARSQRADRLVRLVALVGVVLGVGGGILAALLFTAGIARRVEQIERNAERLARGEALEVLPAGDDEVGRLGQRLQQADRLLRQQEQGLRQAHDSLDRFFTLSLDLLCIAGFDGYFKRLNPAWTETLGWTEDELRAAPFLDFVHPDDREATEREAAGLVQGDTTVAFENRYRCRDGSYRWIEWNSSSLVAEQLIYAAARDVTERRSAEEALRAGEARLQAQNVELAALNREIEAFSYSVSHDLRAPLRAIDGFSQALLEDHAGQFSPTGQDYLGRVRAATQRMGELIDALLTLSRIARTDLARQAVDLGELARSVVENLRRSEPDRDLELSTAPSLVANGDGRLLRVVVENLLTNAWKFTAKTPAARIEVGALDRDGARVFYVRDNGVGFDMAYADKLFGAFQRLHSAQDYPGTGVGLATVQRIIHRHGGHVWAEGAVGHGATFYFSV